MKTFTIYVPNDYEYHDIKADDFYVENEFIIFIRRVNDNSTEKIGAIHQDKCSLIINLEFEIGDSE